MPSAANGADYTSLDLTSATNNESSFDCDGTSICEVKNSVTTQDDDGNDVITYYSTSYLNHLDCTGSIDYVYTCYKF